jgi:hypothetical protein
MKYLYHVTYSGRLPSIAKHGLRAGMARSIGAPAYDFHAAKGLFLTEFAGLFFWFSRAEAFAEHNSDNTLEDGLTPVVLCVETRHVKDAFLDPLGTRDALANAYITPTTIPAKRLLYFDGEEWGQVHRYEDDHIDFTQSYDVEEIEDEYDGDGDGVSTIYSFKQDNPLLPTDET